MREYQKDRGANEEIEQVSIHWASHDTDDRRIRVGWGKEKEAVELVSSTDKRGRSPLMQGKISNSKLRKEPKDRVGTWQLSISAFIFFLKF